MAQMLMVDAFEAVTAGHAGSVKNFLKHKVSQGLRTMSTADRASTGVGLAVAAGVGIAGIVLTGNLALPIIIGIGAGTYALRAAISNIGKTSIGRTVTGCSATSRPPAPASGNMQTSSPASRQTPFAAPSTTTVR